LNFQQQRQVKVELMSDETPALPSLPPETELLTEEDEF
jgi:hypothetical protein